jgi:hypothetical protein
MASYLCPVMYAVSGKMRLTCGAESLDVEAVNIGLMSTGSLQNADAGCSHGINGRTIARHLACVSLWHSMFSSGWLDVGVMVKSSILRQTFREFLRFFPCSHYSASSLCSSLTSSGGVRYTWPSSTCHGLIFFLRLGLHVWLSVRPW